MQTILSLFTSVLGIATSLTGIQNIPLNINQMNVKSYQTEIQSVSSPTSCYNPEPEVTITLKYPDNFINLSDPRNVLNPSLFPTIVPGYKDRFDTNLSTDPTDENSCFTKVLYNLSGQEVSPRTYIRVRTDLRVSSCKTDDLAGPYTLDPQMCTKGQMTAASKARGTCTVLGYPDLRKIAEATDINGNLSEIYWTPFTHNAGCNFDNSKPNCGQGDGSNMNMKEFIYVLKSRDGFDQSNIVDCKVNYDERTKNNNPCSHFFDVYMAKDLYDKLAVLPTGPYSNPYKPGDSEYKYYQNYFLFRDRMQNCQEQNIFTPVVSSPGLTFPPIFIKKPFLFNQFDRAVAGQVLTSAKEVENYCRFTHYQSVTVYDSSLYQLNEFNVGDSLLPKFEECPESVPASDPNNCYTVFDIVPKPSCFAPIGKIDLTDLTNNSVSFQVYGSWDKPTNFYLKDPTGTYNSIYEYVATTREPPVITEYKPSLQLNNLEFISASEWTWATPVCKPAVYLYPPTETDINVKLKLDGKLTVSDPEYDETNGWNVRAKTNGDLIPKSKFQNPNSKSIYPYLYYEADIKGIDIPKEGIVVSKSEVGIQITDIMTKLGFNKKETADFLSYWLPRLQDKPYYFITLLPEEQINQKETLIFSKNVDTLIRTRFVFEGLDLPIFVEPMEITKHERKGFVVTDWGGSLLGRSCDDLSFK